MGYVGEMAEFRNWVFPKGRLQRSWHHFFFIPQAPCGKDVGVSEVSKNDPNDPPFRAEVYPAFEVFLLLFVTFYVHVQQEMDDVFWFRLVSFRFKTHMASKYLSQTVKTNGCAAGNGTVDAC